MMALHLFNGDNWERCADMDAARTMMQDAIDQARDCCDPEWPDWVEQIAVYEAPEDSEEPDEKGTRVLRAKMIHIDKEPSDGIDFWCDYEVGDVPWDDSVAMEGKR
jgi:hypothetical protein